MAEIADMVESEALFVLERELRAIHPAIPIDQHEARRMSFADYEALLSLDGMPLVGLPAVGEPVVDRDAMVWVIVFKTAYPLHASNWVPGPDAMLEYYAAEVGSNYVDGDGLVTASAVMDEETAQILQQIVHARDADVDLYARIRAIPTVQYSHY